MLKSFSEVRFRNLLIRCEDGRKFCCFWHIMSYWNGILEGKNMSSKRYGMTSVNSMDWETKAFQILVQSLKLTIREKLGGISREQVAYSCKRKIISEERRERSRKGKDLYVMDQRRFLFLCDYRLWKPVPLFRKVYCMRTLCSRTSVCPTYIWAHETDGRKAVCSLIVRLS